MSNLIELASLILLTNDERLGVSKERKCYR